MEILLQDKEHDISVTTGEFEGFRKLIGHTLGEYFDVYFKILPAGGALIRMKKIKQIDCEKWPELSPVAAKRAVKAAARRYISRTYAPAGPDRFAFSNIEVSQCGRRRKGCINNELLFFMGETQLPVPPAKMNLKINGRNKTMNLINDGEINILKTPGLSEISFEDNWTERWLNPR